MRSGSRINPAGRTLIATSRSSFVSSARYTSPTPPAPTFSSTPGKQIALLSQQALRYHPITQAVEKRLTRYFSWQWRIKASNADYLQSYKIQTLLRSAGMQINRRFPLRTKERLEKCLEQLQSDKVISGWQYSQWDEDLIQGKHWVESWNTASVLGRVHTAVLQSL
jgi:hypothetical protein